MFQARQGDVLIAKVRKRATGEAVAPEQGRLILAKGEATGHHHSVPASAGTLTREADGVMYLTIDELTAVEHQEHAAIPLEPGTYRVTRQREYTGPERQQWVGD